MEGPLLPSSRWAAVAQILLTGIKERSGSRRHGSTTALATAGSERVGIYLEIFFTDKLEATPAL